MIPKFQSGFEAKSPAKKSKEPLNDVDLRLNFKRRQLVIDGGVGLLQQTLKATWYNTHKVVLKRKKLPEKRIAQDQIGEYPECLDFAHNQG